MANFHSEPYVYLAGLTHKSVLIAWGAFYFKLKHQDGTAKIVDDDSLDSVHPPRKRLIGALSDPYGPATVNVYDSADRLVRSAKTDRENHCWIVGLQPDTEYRYEVLINQKPWTPGTRRDWDPQDECHFLLVTIRGAQMQVRPIGAGDSADLQDIRIQTPHREPVLTPITILR